MGGARSGDGEDPLQTADPQVETVPGFTGVGVWDLAPVSSANGIVYAASMAKSGNEMYALDAGTGTICGGLRPAAPSTQRPRSSTAPCTGGRATRGPASRGAGTPGSTHSVSGCRCSQRRSRSMGLDNGLTHSLTNRLDQIEKKLESSKDVCDELTDFIRKVNGEASKQHPRLSPGQARAIVAAVNSVEAAIGCTDDR